MFSGTCAGLPCTRRATWDTVRHKKATLGAIIYTWYILNEASLTDLTRYILDGASLADLTRYILDGASLADLTHGWILPLETKSGAHSQEKNDL